MDFYFSAKAEKKIDAYLERSANIALSGMSNSYANQHRDELARDALHQMLLDNPELTGFSDMLAKVARERV